LIKNLTTLLATTTCILLIGCQTNFKNYHNKEYAKDFAAIQHTQEKNKDAFIIDTENAVYLILPVMLPKKLNLTEDHLWYELALRKIGSHALVHVRLEMHELQKGKIIYSTHIINQKSDHEVFIKTLCNNNSIIVKIDDPHFYHSIYKPFDGKLELNLYHNLKPIKFGKFYELNTNQLKDAVLEDF
jgi:hypothetical protein